MDRQEEQRFLEFKTRYLKDKNLAEECRKALNYCLDKNLISVKLAKKAQQEGAESMRRMLITALGMMLRDLIQMEDYEN